MTMSFIPSPTTRNWSRSGFVDLFAPIDLDGGGAGVAAMTLGTLVASNTNNADDTPTSSIRKHKSGVWIDFKEIYEVVNCNKI